MPMIDDARGFARCADAVDVGHRMAVRARAEQEKQDDDEYDDECDDDGDADDDFLSVAAAFGSFFVFRGSIFRSILFCGRLRPFRSFRSFRSGSFAVPFGDLFRFGSRLALRHFFGNFFPRHVFFFCHDPSFVSRRDAWFCGAGARPVKHPHGICVKAEGTLSCARRPSFFRIIPHIGAICNPFPPNKRAAGGIFFRALCGHSALPETQFAQKNGILPPISHAFLPFFFFKDAECAKKSKKALCGFFPQSARGKPFTPEGVP